MKLNMARDLNCFFLITNFLIAIAFILKGPFDSVANPIVTSIFYLGVVLLEKFSLFKLKNYIRVLLILTLTSHSLLGEYFRAYYTTAFFDNALHLIGTFSVALFAYELLRAFVKMQSSRPELFIFILVSLLGITLGTFFELIEFFLDLMLKERNQFSLFDTNLDLVYDVIGSLLAGYFLIIMNRWTHCQ